MSTSSDGMVAPKNSRESLGSSSWVPTWVRGSNPPPAGTMTTNGTTKAPTTAAEAIANAAAAPRMQDSPKTERKSVGLNLLPDVVS